MALSFKTDIVAEAKSRLLQQFKGRPNIEALLGAYSDQVQQIENMYKGLINGRSVSTAVGVQLDLVGAIVGAERSGLDDDSYRTIIASAIAKNRSSGTINDIISVLSSAIDAFSGMAPTIIINEPSPALIYITLSEPIDSEDLGQRLSILTGQSRAAGVGHYFVYDFTGSFELSASGAPVFGSQNGFDNGRLSGVSTGS